MGALVAVLNKKGENATKTAIAMLGTLGLRNSQTHGIASASTVKIEKSCKGLQSSDLDSPTVIGYSFRRTLRHDRPQPLKLEEAALVFEGRTFPLNASNSDAEVFARAVGENRELGAEAFVKQVDGEFAFVIAERGRLIAGRDVLGLRPLYYGENTVLAGLASERKALWNAGIEDAESFPPGHVAQVTEQGFYFYLARKLAHMRQRQVTMKTASDELQTLLQRAVRERVAGLKEIAVAFSGGLDSSLLAFLARKAGVDVELVHVSLENQLETEHAKRAADELKLPIHVHTYTEQDVLHTLPTVLYLIEEPDPVKTGIGIPIFWTAEKTGEMKLGVILAGQGGDELFGGYRRYVDDYLQKGKQKVQEKIFRDIDEMHEDNFERDFKICHFHGVEMRLPFAARDIVEYALGLPVELKLEPKNDTLRKLVLRQTARNLGLPKAIVERPKKALQYTTGVSEVLHKIARQNHVSLKEYLERTFQTVFRRTEYHG